MFVPIVGEIAWFVFMCIDGDQGSNRFGENPKAAVKNHNKKARNNRASLRREIIN